MDDAASSNAALIRRIVQLENERDELQRDVEVLCMKLSSGRSTGGTDATSRFQARRVAGLEQELEACNQKAAIYARENANLQEELSEVYRIKAQLADLFKAEAEKNKKVEADVMFFQNNLAATFAERDKLLLEIEKIRASQASLINEIKDMNQRLNENVRNNETQERRCSEVEEELDFHRQVIRKFWKLRNGQPSEISNFTQIAKALLDDPESFWEFGDSTQAKEQIRMKIETLEEALVSCQEDLFVTSAFASAVETQLENEFKASANAVKESTFVKSQLLKYEDGFSTSVKQLKQCYSSIRKDVKEFFDREILSLEMSSRMLPVHTIYSQSKNESQEAFLQALHEKVAALLLLSQEEERHHLEERTIAEFECQLNEFNQRLLQVTNEKVKALMEVADLRYERQQLQDKEKELMRLLERPSSGRLFPAIWSHQPEENNSNKKKKAMVTSSKSYLRSWLRGVDEDPPMQAARMNIENAALGERMATLQQLIKAAHRLKSTLSQTSTSIADKESVRIEVEKLRAALSCISLPLSSSYEGDAEAETSGDSSVLDIISDAGIALVDLLVLLSTTSQ